MSSLCLFSFTAPASTEIYTLSLHDALPICGTRAQDGGRRHAAGRRQRRPIADRKSTRLNSSHQINSYAVFCLKKKINEHNKKVTILNISSESFNASEEVTHN